MKELIDRQQAIDKMVMLPKYFDKTGTLCLDYADVLAVLSEHLPSVEPETAKRIVGKSRDGMTLWYQCDMCNEPVDAQDNFCRGCGRRLTDG